MMVSSPSITLFTTLCFVIGLALVVGNPEVGNDFGSGFFSELDFFPVLLLYTMFLQLLIEGHIMLFSDFF